MAFISELNLYLGFAVSLLFLFATFIYLIQFFKTSRYTAIWLLFSLSFFSLALDNLFSAMNMLNGEAIYLVLGNIAVGIAVTSLIYGLFLYIRERTINRGR